MNNLKPGDYVALIDNFGLKEQVGSVFEVSNVSEDGKFIQVNPIIDQLTKLDINRFHRLETKHISEAKTGDTLLCNNPMYNSMEQFKMQVFKYKGISKYSSISIYVDEIGMCDNNQFIVLSNYSYTNFKLRECIIKIRDTTLEERLELKSLLESFGERIFPSTRVFTNTNNSHSFQFSLYGWSGSSARSNITLHEFLSKFSKQKVRTPKQKTIKTRNKQ